ncbi:armadillo repeat-containing protein gudu-like [Lycorma delicatula]|uniref:armadillo repeat-containing protein gudu-like n=1 Tax=Lycorma delicatula TaxID=130591 RepID=UPI003F50DEB9
MSIDPLHMKYPKGRAHVGKTYRLISSAGIILHMDPDTLQSLKNVDSVEAEIPKQEEQTQTAIAADMLSEDNSKEVLEKSSSEIQKASDITRTVYVEVVEANFCQECDSDEDDIVKLQPSDPNEDIPSEYWQVQKFVKFIKTADQMATALCLAYVDDYNMNDVWVQMGIRDIGIIPTIVRFLERGTRNIQAMSAYMTSKLTRLKKARHAFFAAGGLPLLISLLEVPDSILQHKYFIVNRSCEGPTPRKLVHTHRGTHKLVDLLQNKPDKTFLVSLTGSIWKCSILDDNVLDFNQRNVITLIVPLFSQEDQEEEVLVNTAGALAQMARMPENRLKIQKTGALKPAVNYLFRTNPELLENVLNLLEQCGHEKVCMDEMESYDAVRFIWSMMKNPSNVVKGSACWALVPCIRNSTDSGELVRSLVGALELIIKLLRSNDDILLGQVCAAIAEVSINKENLAIITELGVVPLIADLCKKENEFLTTQLALAVAGCCLWKNNCHQFGQLGVVPPLVQNLRNATSVTATTAGVKALCALSSDPFNCIVMHRNGAVPLLFDAVESDSRELQQAAAGCLYNLRILALSADEAKHHITI